jgi:hypothetical protein
MADQTRLNLALIGLGRLGALRAKILASKQPRVNLVAVCDTKPGADKWAADNLPSSVKFFSDPEECMKDGGARAVLVSTATATHAPLICLALDLELVRSPLAKIPGLINGDLVRQANMRRSMLCAKSPSRSISSLPKRSSTSLRRSLI